MLTLDPVRWDALSQAYGPAGDVARLLAALGSVDDPRQRAELWFALWRMLCHPDAVFTASYAAVPHLLHIARALPFPEPVEAIHLVCCIELGRHRPSAPAMPPELLHAYASSVDRLPTLVGKYAREEWGEDVARILAAALVVGKRQTDLGAMILAVDRDHG